VSERSNATELCRDCLHAWAWHFHVNQTGTACLFWDCGCHGFAPAAPPPEGSQPGRCPWCQKPGGTVSVPPGFLWHDACWQAFDPPPTPPPGQEGEAVARRVVLANGNYCDRHEPELQLVCERCGSREATPPPGQDVEEQARALPEHVGRMLFEQANAIACEGEDQEPDEGPPLPRLTHEQFMAIRKAAYGYLEGAWRAAQAEAERRAQEAEHGIARWEVYAQGLEAQVRSAREAAELTLNTLADIRRGFAKGVDPARWVEQASAPLRALSSSPVSSQREPKA
jgi:hypothetical protein